MTNKFKLSAAFAGVALLGAALAGAAVFWYGPQLPFGAALAPKAIEAAEKPARYVSLDKVIVMLKRAPGEAQPHYISADLVLATTHEDERLTKEHLPLLRSIAVRALSRYAFSEASAMTVEQYAEQLNRAFEASYTKDKSAKPFSEVLIGKLIIE